MRVKVKHTKLPAGMTISCVLFWFYRILLALYLEGGSKMDWRQESQAVIEDIREDVKEIVISSKLLGDDTGIYLNVTTLDGGKFCIRMSTMGFEIAAKEYDLDTSGDNEPVLFETSYALLSAISKLYTESFANRLCAAMKDIPQ